MAKAQIVEPCQHMTRPDFHAWSERQMAGRFERIDGVVVAMAPERVEHNDRKMLAWLALRRAVRDAALPCHVNGDGLTVEIGASDAPAAQLAHGMVGWRVFGSVIWLIAFRACFLTARLSASAQQHRQHHGAGKPAGHIRSR